MDRRTDQQFYPPVEMQFYISVMFLGLPDDIHEENLHSCNLKKTLEFGEYKGYRISEPLKKQAKIFEVKVGSA